MPTCLALYREICVTIPVVQTTRGDALPSYHTSPCIEFGFLSSLLLPVCRLSERSGYVGEPSLPGCVFGSVVVHQRQFLQAGEHIGQTLQSVGSVQWSHGWCYCTSVAEWASDLANALGPLNSVFLKETEESC